MSDTILSRVEWKRTLPALAVGVLTEPLEETTLATMRWLDGEIASPRSAPLFARAHVPTKTVQGLIADLERRDEYLTSKLNEQIARDIRESRGEHLTAICRRASKLFYFFKHLPKEDEPRFVGVSTNDLSAADAALTCWGRVFVARRQSKLPITEAELQFARELADDAEPFIQGRASRQKAATAGYVRRSLENLRVQVAAGAP